MPTRPASVWLWKFLALFLLVWLIGCTEEDRHQRQVTQGKEAPAATRKCRQRASSLADTPVQLSDENSQKGGPDQREHATPPQGQLPSRTSEPERRIINAILGTIEEEMRLRDEPESEKTRAALARLQDKRMALYKELRNELEASR